MRGGDHPGILASFRLAELTPDEIRDATAKLITEMRGKYDEVRAKINDLVTYFDYIYWGKWVTYRYTLSLGGQGRKGRRFLRQLHWAAHRYRGRAGGLGDAVGFCSARCR